MGVCLGRQLAVLPSVRPSPMARSDQRGGGHASPRPRSVGLAKRPLLSESQKSIINELTRAPKRADEQPVEMMHAAFAEDGVSTALVRLRAQTPLHRLANRDVLPLDF